MNIDDIIDNPELLDDPTPREILQSAYEALKKANIGQIVTDDDRLAVKRILSLDGIMGPDIIKEFYNKLTLGQDERFRHEMETVVELFEDTDLVFMKFPGLNENNGIPRFVNRFREQADIYMKSEAQNVNLTSEKKAELERLSRLINTRLPIILYFTKFSEKELQPVSIKSEKGQEIAVGYSANIMEIMIKHALSILDSKDVDAAWNDDILFVLMQLKNNGEFNNYDLDPLIRLELDHKQKEFAKTNFPPEVVKSALETVNNISEEYKKWGITNNTDLQIKFIEAYKKLYLYELLLGKQKDSDAYDRKFLDFAFRQIYDFGIQSNTTKINTKTLLLRMVQDYIVSRIQNHIFGLPKGLKKPKNDFLLTECLIDDVGIDTIPVQELTLFNPESFLHDARTQALLIPLINREIDFLSKKVESRVGAFHTFTSYKAMKYHLIEKFRSDIDALNQKKSPIEYSSGIASLINEISALENYPVGLSKWDRDEDRRQKIDTLTKVIESAVYRNLAINTNGILKNTTQSDTSVIDEIVASRVYELKNTPLGEVLKFEYREDGTPKELDEIIADQEEEITTGKLNPQVGPDDLVERIKLRFEIMMERAREYSKEEDCYSRIAKFISDHHDMLMHDEILGEELPMDYTEYTGLEDERVDYYVNQATPEGMENARFWADMNDMVRTISKKKNFANLRDYLLQELLNPDSITWREMISSVQQKLGDERY